MCWTHPFVEVELISANSDFTFIIKWMHWLHFQKQQFPHGVEESVLLRQFASCNMKCLILKAAVSLLLLWGFYRGVKHAWGRKSEWSLQQRHTQFNKVSEAVCVEQQEGVVLFFCTVGTDKLSLPCRSHSSEQSVLYFFLLLGLWTVQPHTPTPLFSSAPAVWGKTL